MTRLLKTVAITLLFIVGITFAMENNEPVGLRYFGWESRPIPIFLIVLVSVLFGVLLAGFGFLFDQWSLKRALREKDGEIEVLESELRASRERERPIESHK
jgi:uncharacterized integral membrane protein